MTHKQAQLIEGIHFWVEIKGGNYCARCSLGSQYFWNGDSVEEAFTGLLRVVADVINPR